MLPKNSFYDSPHEPDWPGLQHAYGLYHSSQVNSAIEAFKGLASKGSLIACNYLGNIYEAIEQGEGRDAEGWYRMAAEKGFPPSKYYLGRFYFNRSEYSESFKWFKSAADDGFIPAMYWTFMHYYWGRGVEKSDEFADKYLFSASEKGHVIAQINKAKLMLRGRYGVLRRPLGLILLAIYTIRGAYMYQKKTDHDLLY